MSDIPLSATREHSQPRLLSLLWQDKFAFVAALFLLLLTCCALFGPWLLAVELASMLLLAGLIAAYHLAKK